MNVKRLTITTDASGDFAADVKAQGEILAIGLDLGTLDTPDLTVTELTFGTAVLSKAGVAADVLWHPRAKAVGVTAVTLAAAAGPPAVDDVYAPVVATGTLHVVVAGGGALKSGTLVICTRG